MVQRSHAFYRVVALMTSVGFLVGGCTRTRVDMVARYQPGAPSRVDRTPDVGVYKIKYTPAGDEEMKTLHGSKRFLGKGQPLGFERGAGGEVIAVAGEERFTALLPQGARFCVWYTKSKERSDFAAHVGDTLGAVAVGTLVVGGLFALALLNDDDDCSHGIDRDRCRHCRR